VVIGDLNHVGAQALAGRLGKEQDIKPLQMDVTNSQDWLHAVNVCVESWGSLDILVNNAGTTYKNKVSINYFSFLMEQRCSDEGEDTKAIPSWTNVNYSAAIVNPRSYSR
jgi:NAD(P)-dependent dehydrogenase (short-subunit alcohol dehydrogenase family)